MSVAKAIRERVLVSGDRFWRVDDFEGSPYAIEKTLSRLAAAGELRRLRPGIYWRGSATALGMAPPKTKDLIAEMVGTTGIGPASSSAAYSLGLSTQIPRVETIAVPGRPPTPIKGIRFVSRAASSRKEVGLTSIEVALLEVLREWTRVVDVSPEEMRIRIGELISQGAIRPSRIAKAARREPPRVREGLRTILVGLGFSRDAERISPCRQKEALIPQPV